MLARGWILKGSGGGRHPVLGCKGSLNWADWLLLPGEAGSWRVVLGPVQPTPTPRLHTVHTQSLIFQEQSLGWIPCSPPMVKEIYYSHKLFSSSPCPETDGFYLDKWWGQVSWAESRVGVRPALRREAQSARISGCWLQDRLPPSTPLCLENSAEPGFVALPGKCP